jgi:formylglycine-generating enzyme required for sulfatase activity
MKRSLSVWILVLALGILTISSSGDCAEAVKTPKKLGPPRKAVKVAEDPNAEVITNSIGMKLRRIEPGSFMMGSEDEHLAGKPVHKVNITKPFYIGVYEVTAEEFKGLMHTGLDDPETAKFPISVTWKEAQEFCLKLSKTEGYRYFLPSEAQWEYACRAGTTTKYYWGEEINGDYIWLQPNPGRGVYEVGQKKPNRWGLYDMLGNAYEHCQDWWGGYPDHEVKDPTGPTSGERKVKRGGDASGALDYSTCAARSFTEVADPYNEKAGFRVCRSTYKVDSINTANRDAAKTGRITGAVAISDTQCPGCNKEIQSEWKFCNQDTECH